MLTVEKLNIYEKYHGDEDGFFRFGKKKDQAVLTEKDWFEIEALLRQLYLVHRGLASKEFEVKLNKRLSQNTKTIEAKEKLTSFLNKKWYP